MLRWTLLLALALFLISPTHAQPATAERVPAAETAFDNGIDSYRRGEYAEAFRLFTRAAADFEYHARTTAALLMAGKAAYAEGDLDLAISTLTGLLRQYPESRYADEAERVRRLALRGGPSASVAPPFDLGVVLPATGPNGFLAQALFNGVRIAVDEHNAGRPVRAVRLVFRDSEGSAEGARAALSDALAAGADAVIGPLFSDEALAAAEVAEREQVTLVAPLATDEGVALSRRYVFQANPTFAMRGRAMAAYAVRGLRLSAVGVVAERGSYGETMAEAFADEARRLGASVPLDARLPDAAGWRRLPEIVGPGLETVQAVYLPVTGADAAEHAASTLRGLEGLGLEGRVRPLGNTEWEGLEASRNRASRFGTLFTQDFHLDRPAAAGFNARYRELAGLPADRLALMGYDTTRLLLGLLDESGEGTMADRLRAAPRHEGLAHRLHFDGGQVNRALFIMGYLSGEPMLVE